MDNNIVLEIKNLTKQYGDRKAVDNISFKVEEGLVFGFIGPNGAGKSTTIKMITGLCTITKGDVFICGKSIKKNFEKAIRNVGAIIENPEMFGYMTGLQNLKYFASLQYGVNDARIKEVAKTVGLDRRINDKVSKYSLGMKQRLGIAQALLHKPKLIILDEPTNGLDVNGIIEMRKLLKKLAHQDGITVMVSSHILGEMEKLCDEIAIIVNGKISKIKTLEEIKKGLQEKTVYYITTKFPNYAGKVLKEKFDINCKVNPQKTKLLFQCAVEKIPQIISHLSNSNISIFGVGKLEMTLEDEFLKAIGNSDTSIH